MGAGRGRQRVGRRGEDLAVAELEHQGVEVLARNWRCGRLGEVDIVGLERGPGGSTVVFYEVKCRTGLGFGHPLEAITWAKLRTLRQLAAEWMNDQHTAASRIRVDAIGVLLSPGQPPQITHVRAVG